VERCVGAYDERGVLVIVGVCVCAMWGNRGRREMEGEARAGVKIEEMGVREREGRVDRLEKEKAGLDGVGGGGWI